jgi:uncharacterized protein
MQLARKLADLIMRDSAPARCMRRDALSGKAYAQAALGDMYRKGTLVRQNHAEAVKWYRLAAEQGDAHSQFQLGASYTRGRGVPQDDGEAVKWYRLAAEQGDALAQFNLGAHYSSGRGVPQDAITAYMWFELSMLHGTGAAADSRRTVARTLSPHQVERAEQMARDWMAARAKPSAQA